jgi:hypothetical protein
MIIQKINWWLGNQMFQYAFIKSLSIRNKIDFRLDISWSNTYLRKYELEIFNIDKKYSRTADLPFYERLFFNSKIANFITSKIIYFFKKYNHNHHIEKQYNYDDDFMKIKTWYVEWFFQTEKYFIDFEEIIRKDFEFIKPINERNSNILSIITSVNSVSIHVRRWDYISNNKTNQFHWTCSVDYYLNAIKKIRAKISNPIFFIFSDDIEWAKLNITVDSECFYIDWNNNLDGFEDMRLMSFCKHNIIANSSFSWWWAWLNKNIEKIVIWPQNWFNDNSMNTEDIMPKNWIRI